MTPSARAGEMRGMLRPVNRMAARRGTRTLVVGFVLCAALASGIAAIHAVAAPATQVSAGPLWLEPTLGGPPPVIGNLRPPAQD